MANLPISSLPLPAPISGTDLYASTQVTGVGPVQVTAADLKTFIGTNLTLTGTPILPQTFTIGTVSYTWPAANGAVGSVLTNNGAGNLSWTTTSLGTVTSVGLDASPVGLIVSNSPVTASGNLVISGGVLNVANGGTGASTPAAALINLLPPTSPSTAAYVLANDGSGNFYWTAGGGGGGGGGGVATFSAGTTGLTTNSATGNVVLGGTLGIANGGTGVTTLPALQALVLPSQAGQGGKVLSTNGTVTSWIPVSGTGTVTSVGFSGGSTGLTVTGTNPITAAGTFTLGGTLAVANGGTGLTALGTNVQTALGLATNSNGGFLTGGTGGVLPIAQGGTGNSTAPTSGQLLIGNGSGGYTVASLTAGANVTITPSSGGITIAATGGGGGGGGTVTTVGSTLSGITVTNPTTTPSIGGTLGFANGGTGLTATPAAGEIPIGTGAGYALATLTGGTGITITNAAGSITIDATGTAGVSTFSGGTTGLTPAAATSGVVTLAGTLAIGHGGTGLATLGASGLALVSNGTALVYGNPNAATNIVGGTTGQIPYQSGVSTTAFQGPGASGTYLGGNGVAAPTFKVAQTTLGSTVLSLNTTTTALAGMTGITMTPTYTPSATKDVATKDYVDANVSAVSRLAPVKLVSVTDFPPTGGGSIDGTALVNGLRVLLVNNTLGATNGVWTVNTGGAWSRPTDADTWAEYVSASVFVTNGTSYANTSWIQTAPAGGTIDVTAQVWSQQSGIYNYVAGTGISIAGTTINNTGVLSWGGGTTGLTPAAATTGAITLTGTLNIANGGTQATTAQGARTNLLPSQSGNAGKYLQTNGTDVVWATTSGGAVYYIDITTGGTVQSKITGAGYTDAVGNSYVLYNSSSSNITLTATGFPNADSFTDCTSTAIVVGAKKTMMVSTTNIAASGTYAIDASNYLSGGVFVTSITGSTTMASILSTLSVIDNEGNVYVITNTGTATAVVSGLTVDNANALPGYTTATNFNIPVNATATIVSTVASTNYVVESITNSVSTNLSGGSVGKIAYQTAANTTDFLPTGTTGQYLVSAGAAAPVWTTVPKIGIYYVAITAGGTVQTALATATNGEVQYAEYVIFNNSTSNSVLTNASGWDNGASWPSNVSGNNLTLRPNQTVTIAIKTVGANYSVVAVSDLPLSSVATFSAAGTVDSVLTGITQQVGAIYVLRNTDATNTLSLTGTLTNFQPFAPAATAASVAVQAGQEVTVRCVTPGSAYDIVNLTHPSQAFNTTTDLTLTTTISGRGLVNGDLITITNTDTANHTLTAASFDNSASYPTQSTSTVFTMPPNSSVTLQLNSTSASNWAIVAYATKGNAGNVVFRAATSSSYTNSGLTGGVTLGTNSGVTFMSMLFTNQAATINPQGYYNPTNGRWTPTVAGYYEVNFRYMFRANSSSGTSGYVAIFKNGSFYCMGYDDTATFCSPEIGTLVYMNGTTDYLQTAASVNAGASTITIVDGGCEWDIALVNQQAITNTNTGNYRISASANNTIPALLAANVPVITDVANNIYVITNTSSSAITLTAGNYTGYQLFGAFFTSATSVTMPAGSVLELMCITVGTDYQVVTMSQPTVNGAVAFAIGNGAGSPATLAPSKTVDGIILFPVTTYGTYDTASYINPQNYLDPATGIFNPKTAGYYQINASLGQAASNTTPVMSVAIVKNWNDASPDIIAIASDYVATNGGVNQSSSASTVVYMNGTTDTLRMALYISTGAWAPATTVNSINFSGYLTCQTNTQVVGTTASALVSLAATQAIPNNTVTKIAFDTVGADPQSWWNSANKRFIPTIPGYYQISGEMTYVTGNQTIYEVTVYKNGTGIYNSLENSNNYVSIPMSTVVYMNGTTDYLEVYAYQPSGISINIGGNVTRNMFAISLIGANQAVPAVTDTKFATSRANGVVGDYCVVQLDNIKTGFRNIGPAYLWLSTVTGTATVYGEITTLWYGGGGGAVGISNAANQNPRNLTTTPDLLFSSGQAGQINAIFTDNVSGRTYRATWIVGYGYVNMQVFLERISG